MGKRKLDLLVLSDMHLGASGSNAKDLLLYLKTINPKAIVLNGDIIDGWNFQKRNFGQVHFEVIRRLIKMMNAGCKIYYVTGNHDEFLRRYHGLKVSNFQIVDQIVLNLDGKRYWFFHGDLFDVSIQGNMKFLARLGGRAYDLLIWVNRNLNKLLKLFGQESMSFSKKVKNSVKLAVKWVNDFEQMAIDMAIEEGYDGVCCGHIHAPQIKTVVSDSGCTTYLNSGDWIEHNSALEYSAGEWSVSTFWHFEQDVDIDMEEFFDELEAIKYS